MNGVLEIVLGIGDVLLGWLLYLPSDIRLIALAAMTTVLMAIFKKLLTDGDWLARARRDQSTLSGLARKARRDGDRTGLERYRRTGAILQMRRLRIELRVLIVAIVPLLIIGLWSWHRMAFHAPAKNESVEVSVVGPASAVGNIIYLVPEKGIEADAWIARLEPLEGDRFACQAVWRLRATSDESSAYHLTLRTADLAFPQSVIMGGVRYQSPPYTEHGNGWRSEIRMTDVRFLGVIPGIEGWGCPPWLTAYILLVSVFLPLTRRFFRVT